MADIDDWTAADDEALRGALATLRRPEPLPDVRFVKARGDQRRRHTYAAWATGAAAAAAVVVAVVTSSLGGSRALEVVPATTTTPSVSVPSPTYSGHFDQPGALPLPQEWQEALGGTGTLAVGRVSYAGLECGDAASTAPTRAEALTGTSSPVQGGQYLWTFPTADAARDAAGAIAAAMSPCSGPNADRITTKSIRTSDPYPMVWSFTAKGASGGYYLLARAGRDVAVLTINPESGKTLAVDDVEVIALAEVAQKRLETYGTGSSVTSSPSSPPRSIPGPGTPTQPSSGSTAPAGAAPAVNGVPGAVPAARLFVPLGSWSSSILTGGAAAVDGPSDRGPESGVAPCDQDPVTYDNGAGVTFGTWGVAHIAPSTTRLNVAFQRVRSFASGETEAGPLVSNYVDSLRSAFAAGCTEGEARTTGTKGPGEGTYKLTQVSGGQTFVSFVGVTTTADKRSVSTIALFNAAMTDAAAFAELDRLLALAATR